MKAYGFRCEKCGSIVDDTKAPCLVYAKTADEACDKHLQDAIKEHDIVAHGSDQDWPKFKIVIFYQKKKG